MSICNGCRDNNPSAPDANPLHYFSDMEQYDGFVDGLPVTQSSIAHSGKYMVRIDSLNPFGIGFKRKMNTISTRNIISLDVSTYLYADSLPLKAALVCSIENNDNKPVYYETSDVNKFLSETKKWTKLSALFHFPDSMKPDQRIVVYVFNPNKEILYMDDFELNFITK